MFKINKILVISLLFVSGLANANSYCPELEKIIRSESTLDGIIRQVEKERFGLSKKRQCIEFLKKNKKFQKLLKASQRKSVIKNVRIKPRKKSAKNNVQNRIITTGKKAVNRYKRNSKIAAPGKRSRLAIERILPETIVPGGYITIVGKSFGTQHGSVELYINNQVYPVTIHEWDNEWISVEIDDRISGVVNSSNARLKVYTVKSGNTVARNLEFLPVYEDRLVVATVIDLKTLWLPGEQTVHLFENQVLQNNWKVKRAEVLTYGTGRCTFGSPSISVGGTNLEARVTAKVELFQSATRCEVVIEYEGPRGTEPGVVFTL